MRAAPSGVIAAWLLAACGPIKSTTTLVDAAAEVAAAKNARADQVAVYEYTAAEAYLHKAREEQSFSDFEDSIGFARKSRDCARLARARAESQLKSDLSGSPAAAIPLELECKPGPLGLGARAGSSTIKAGSHFEPRDPAPAPPPAAAPPAATRPAPKRAAPPAAAPESKKPVAPKDVSLPQGEDDK